MIRFRRVTGEENGVKKNISGRGFSIGKSIDVGEGMVSLVNLNYLVYLKYGVKWSEEVN